MQELEGEIGEMPTEMGWAFGTDGERENGKQSRSVEGARYEEKRRTMAEMGSLGGEGYQ